MKTEAFDPKNETPTIQTRMMVPRMLWAAMLLATLMYLFLISNQSETSLNTNFKILTTENPMVKGLAIAAILLLIASWQIPKLFARRNATQSVDAFQVWFTGFIIRLAMLEAISILGLKLAFLTHDINDAVPFFIVTWVGFLMSFPTVDQATRSTN